MLKRKSERGSVASAVGARGLDAQVNSPNIREREPRER